MQCIAFTLSADAQLGRCAPKRGKTRQKRPLFGYRLITRFYRPRLACCHARQGARSAAAGQRGILPPRCRSRCRSSLQLVEVSRPVHAGAGNLSAYERTKLALGRRYNRTKKAQGGDRKSEKSKDQIDPLIPSTAAKLAAEHSVSEATVKRASASSVHASPLQRIGWHLVPATGRNARESPPARRRKRSCP